MRIPPVVMLALFGCWHSSVQPAVEGTPANVAERAPRGAAERWLNRSRDSVVPIWALGQPVAELRHELAPLHPEDQDPAFYAPSLRWHDRSIAGTEIELIAYHQRGTIVGIEVSIDSDPDLLAWHRLVAVFGTPGPAVVETDNQQWRWTNPISIVLDNWVGDLPVPAPGQPLGTQDMHPATPNGNHTQILFGEKPPS